MWRRRLKVETFLQTPYFFLPLFQLVGTKCCFYCCCWQTTNQNEWSINSNIIENHGNSRISSHYQEKSKKYFFFFLQDLCIQRTAEQGHISTWRRKDDIITNWGNLNTVLLIRLFFFFLGFIDDCLYLSRHTLLLFYIVLAKSGKRDWSNVEIKCLLRLFFYLLFLLSRLSYVRWVGEK